MPDRWTAVQECRQSDETGLGNLSLAFTAAKSPINRTDKKSAVAGRGQRDKRAAEEAAAAGQVVQIIDVSEHKPRRIPSAKWRELIKTVWEADPLLCPKCRKEMRIVALIDDRDVIERILRHLGLWEQGVRVSPARAPPEIAEWVIEPCCDDPFPCLPRRSEAKTGLRHRTGDDVRERLSARGRGDLFCRQASGPVAVHLDASTPLRLPSPP